MSGSTDDDRSTPRGRGRRTQPAEPAGPSADSTYRTRGWRPPPPGFFRALQCSMVFLIDGYNLLHAAGLAGPSLRSARRRLLDWLADAVRGREDTLQVVFDAPGRTRRLSRTGSPRGPRPVRLSSNGRRPDRSPARGRVPTSRVWSWFRTTAGCTRRPAAAGRRRGRASGSWTGWSTPSGRQRSPSRRRERNPSRAVAGRGGGVGPGVQGGPPPAEMRRA